jgi:hypothetical protein
LRLARKQSDNVEARLENVTISRLHAKLAT